MLARATRLCRRAVAAVAVVAVVGASDVRADDLTRMLEKGPMVRVDVDKAGKFDGVVAVVDIDAPAERVWQVLLDFRNYDSFMPRVDDVDVEDRAGVAHVVWNINTPLVRTKYTNSMTIDDKNRLLLARTVEGDMKGSRYDWRVLSLSPSKSRLVHSAWPRNMPGLVATLDDEAQTITVGVAVSSVMATTRAIKQRAQLLEKGAAVPTLSAPTPTP